MVQITTCPFVSTIHFLDLTVDDPEFKRIMMHNLIHEKYQISKRLHTSFTELDEITPTERKALLKLIVDDLQEQERIISAAKAASGN